jgi:hypothetical protein
MLQPTQFTGYIAHNKGPSVRKELENYIEGNGRYYPDILQK